MKKFTFILLVVVSVLTFTIYVGASTKTLKIAGSPTVQKRIVEPAKRAIEDATGIIVKIRGINAGNGFKELRRGRVPAFISSSPLKSLLEKAGIAGSKRYQEHVIAEEVIVPIVHPSNPVSELTWEQLSAINTGKISNWKDVGGPGMLISVITSQPTAATRTVFQKQVMKMQPYVKTITEVKSTRDKIAMVTNDKGAIGAVSEGFVKMFPDMVKVVKTARISRPLSFITNGDPNPDVKAVIDFLRTPDAKKLYK